MKSDDSPEIQDRGETLDIPGLPSGEMKWQSHLNNLCKIVSKNIFLLSKLRHYVNAKTRKLLYSVYILSHINYMPLPSGTAAVRSI